MCFFLFSVAKEIFRYIPCSSGHTHTGSIDDDDDVNAISDAQVIYVISMELSSSYFFFFFYSNECISLSSFLEEVHRP